MVLSYPRHFSEGPNLDPLGLNARKWLFDVEVCSGPNIGPHKAAKWTNSVDVFDPDLLHLKTSRVVCSQNYCKVGMDSSTLQ